MKTILCFGDSNTFGSNPDGVPERHPYDIRWPGRLQKILGNKFYVIEEGMGGRTTVWEDPLAPGRCGASFLPVALQSHKPIDLVILSLGTNDCKSIFHASPRVIGKGMSCLVDMIRRFDYGTGTAAPKILLISPILMGDDIEHSIFESFDRQSAETVKRLAPVYKEIAQEKNCVCFDASLAAGPGKDQLHMDGAAHEALAAALSVVIKHML